MTTKQIISHVFDPNVKFRPKPSTIYSISRPAVMATYLISTPNASPIPYSTFQVNHLNTQSQLSLGHPHTTIIHQLISWPPSSVPNLRSYLSCQWSLYWSANNQINNDLTYSFPRPIIVIQNVYINLAKALKRNILTLSKAKVCKTIKSSEH